jgi:hypothetical protein
VIDEERQRQILIEVTIPRATKTRDRNAEEREFRRLLKRDVRRLKRAGVEVVVPNVEPDLNTEP